MTIDIDNVTPIRPVGDYQVSAFQSMMSTGHFVDSRYELTLPPDDVLNKRLNYLIEREIAEEVVKPSVKSAKPRLQVGVQYMNHIRWTEKVNVRDYLDALKNLSADEMEKETYTWIYRTMMPKAKHILVDDQGNIKNPDLYEYFAEQGVYISVINKEVLQIVYKTATLVWNLK